MRSPAVLLLLVTVLVGCGGGPDEDTAEPSCADLTVIGARGSGQGIDSADLSGFGPETAGIAHAVADAAAEPPRSWRSDFVGVDYPAVDVTTVRADPASFDDSVRAGAVAAVELATGAVSACPATRVLVIGLSQGATVAHGFAALLGADPDLAGVVDRLLGVVLLGDPTRRRADVEVEHADLDGVASADGFLATVSLDLPASLAGKVLSVCAAGDNVCSSPRATDFATIEIAAVHNTAYARADVVAGVVSWLADRPLAATGAGER